MARFLSRLALSVAIVAGLAAAAAPFKDTLSLAKYLAQLKPAKADLRTSYGPAKSQYADLYLPKDAREAVPVVILVHGGCWNVEVPAETLASNAADLTRAGVAVWNIEYRRIGEPGGGYPGMYEDVGAAFDMLRSVAGAHRLDLTRVTVVGHSSGAHLGMWGAARHKLPAGHGLRGADPLPVRSVLSVGGRPISNTRPSCCRLLVRAWQRSIKSWVQKPPIAPNPLPTRQRTRCSRWVFAPGRSWVNMTMFCRPISGCGGKGWRRARAMMSLPMSSRARGISIWLRPANPNGGKSAH